jgi:hypothetical protein
MYRYLTSIPGARFSINLCEEDALKMWTDFVLQDMTY